MTAPTLLNADILHRLMRIFMEHRTDVLPVVERGRIIGQLDRLAIMEALSEIRPEGYPLTLKSAESADELLRRLDNSGNETIPTINRNYEFNALWGRAEILQAQGKIPQVKIWQPDSGTLPAEPEVSTARFTPAPASADTPINTRTTQPETPAVTTPSRLSELAAAARARTQPVAEQATTAPKVSSPATITIVREAPVTIQRATGTEADTLATDAGDLRPEIQKTTRPIAESLHRDIERGRLAINTLAALDLPLLACDGAGTEIFHNRAFGDIRLRNATYLDSTDLVRKAKDAIAESALKGDLDIDKAVKLRAAVRGFDIYCKAIRDFENPAARAQGYIFWLEANTPAVTALYAADSMTGDFAGKTLPDILAAEESRAMAWAMREAGGNQSDAALLLGIPRQTFNYRYRKLMKAQAAQSLRAGHAAEKKAEKKS